MLLVAVVGIHARRAVTYSRFNMVGRLSLIAMAGAAAIALTSALAAPAASDANRLTVRTGPDLKIELTRGGKEVDYLRRGRHTITIRDTSRAHNVMFFRCAYLQTGVPPWAPCRVDTSGSTLTTFAFVGTKTVSVRVRPGRYTLMCSRHGSRGMHDPFLVE